MFDLRFMTHPFEVFGAVVVFDVIDVNDEVVLAAGLFDEVLSHEAVQVVVLAIGFSADRYARITLREARS